MPLSSICILWVQSHGPFRLALEWPPAVLVRPVQMAPSAQQSRAIPRVDFPGQVQARNTPGKAQIFPTEYSRLIILAIWKGHSMWERSTPSEWLLLGLACTGDRVPGAPSLPFQPAPVHSSTKALQRQPCDHDLNLSNWWGSLLLLVMPQSNKGLCPWKHYSKLNVLLPSMWTAWKNSWVCCNLKSKVVVMVKGHSYQPHLLFQFLAMLLNSHRWITSLEENLETTISLECTSPIICQLIGGHLV